jgi:hypothetical protein
MEDAEDEAQAMQRVGYLSYNLFACHMMYIRHRTSAGRAKGWQKGKTECNSGWRF